jgi:hypothetical protein
VTRRDGTPAEALSINRPLPLGPVFAAVLFLAGCAAPGQPKPPAPVVPRPVADLAARQTGPGVTLSFTLPDQAADGEPLSSPPSIEIFRGFVPSGATTPEPRAAAQVYLLPGAVVETYLTGGKVRFVDPLAPEELARHAGQQAFYFVRAFVSKKHPSAGSNLAGITLEAPPPPVENLAARVTPDAIVLDWQPLPAGSSAAPLGYHVYRALVRQGAGAVAGRNLSPEQLETPLELLAATPLPAYRDTQFAFGRTYLYLVRAVAEYESGPVESGDSTKLLVTPRDTFPPAPPGGLVAILAPGPGELPLAELSWNSSPETDLAGYNVYRSEQSGKRGERLNRGLLLVPAFRDSTAVPGGRYYYSVTAVDRAGNESAPGEAVSLTIPGRQNETKP